MSQQINLLPRRPAPPSISAKRTLLLLSLCLLGTASYGEWQKMKADKLDQTVQRTERHLQQQQALIKNLQQKLGAPQGNLAAQIAALEPQTRVSKDILARLKTGELGSIDGYGEQLVALARITQPGIWLTSITVGNAGHKVIIEGRALKKNQILLYASQLNQAMEKFETQFSEVDIVQIPAALQKDIQQADAQQENIFSFRLY